MMQTLKTYWHETILNFNSGMISYLLHRITGIGLVLYTFPHLYSIGQARQGAFDEFMAQYNQPYFHLGEYLLLLCVLIHLLNGIKITVADFWLKTRSHRWLVGAEIAIFVLIALVSLPVFFPSIKSVLGW